MYVVCGAKPIRLYSYTANGTTRWNVQINPVLEFTSPAATLCPDGSALYVSSAKNLYAITAATGSVIWTYSAAFAISTFPIIANNGFVLIAEWQCNPCQMYAVRPADGSLVWKSAVDQVLSTPAISGDIVFFTNYNVLFGKSITNGTTVFKTGSRTFGDGGTISKSPVIDSRGVCYITVGSHAVDPGLTYVLSVYAVQCASSPTSAAGLGTVIWSINYPAPIHPFGTYLGMPGMSADGQYVIVGSSDVNVLGIRAADGAIAWRYNDTALSVKCQANYYNSAPTISSDGIIYISNNGVFSDCVYFYALTSDGRLLWRYQVVNPSSFVAMDKDSNLYITGKPSSIIKISNNATSAHGTTSSPVSKPTSSPTVLSTRAPTIASAPTGGAPSANGITSSPVCKPTTGPTPAATSKMPTGTPPATTAQPSSASPLATLKPTLQPTTGSTPGNTRNSTSSAVKGSVNANGQIAMKPYTTGAIAGICIGSLAGVVVVVSACMMLGRAFKRSLTLPMAATDSSSGNIDGNGSQEVRFGSVISRSSTVDLIPAAIPGLGQTNKRLSAATTDSTASNYPI